MTRVKSWLTSILLEVTDNEISNIAVDVYQHCSKGIWVDNSLLSTSYDICFIMNVREVCLLLSLLLHIFFVFWKAPAKPLIQSSALSSICDTGKFFFWFLTSLSSICRLLLSLFNQVVYLIKVSEFLIVCGYGGNTVTSG